MNLRERLEHIRQQPEHIRLRYVLLLLILSMALIVTLWIFSLQENFRNTAVDTKSAIQNGTDTIKKQSGGSSLQDLLKEAKSADTGTPQNGTDFFNQAIQERSNAAKQ